MSTLPDITTLDEAALYSLLQALLARLQTPQLPRITLGMDTDSPPMAGALVGVSLPDGEFVTLAVCETLAATQHYIGLLQADLEQARHEAAQYFADQEDLIW